MNNYRKKPLRAFLHVAQSISRQWGTSAIEILIITPLLLAAVIGVVYVGSEVQSDKYSWLGANLLGQDHINDRTLNIDGSNSNTGSTGGEQHNGPNSYRPGANNSHTGNTGPHVDIDDSDYGCEPSDEAQSAEGEAALEQDTGFFGSVWNSIKDTLGASIDFVRGFWEGLKKQVSDLAQMIFDPIETGKSLIALGKAFIDDAPGTIAAIGEAIGKDLSAMVHCGAFDRGRLIGENVSPAFMFKLVGKLAKFDGDLFAAIRDTKKDLDIECASFIAGTDVWTVDGMVPIESIAVQQFVHSRHDTTFKNTPQIVNDLLSRTANHYYQLTTEHDVISLTGEHPVWIQGTGWVKADQVKRGNILASADGDTLVLGNTRIDKAVTVYNFSVTNTPSYFVGKGKLWVHNATCELTWTTKIDGLPNIELIPINKVELFNPPTISSSNIRDNLIGQYPDLKNFKTGTEAAWQGHHIIPSKLQHDLLDDLGFDKNSIHNGIPLPKNRGADSTPHVGNHVDAYDNAIEGFLDDLEDMNIADNPAVEAIIKDALIRGIGDLRQAFADRTVELNLDKTLSKAQYDEILSTALEQAKNRLASQ